LKPSLVGRSAEFDRLRRWSADVEAGKTTVAVIQGEAGIGKTRLVEAAVDRMPGWSVAMANADQAESKLPYALLERVTRSLARFDVRRPPAVGFRHASGMDPLAVGASMVQILGSTPSATPVALVVDDAGWADQQSLRALTFALRRMDADRLLVIFVVRSEDSYRIPEGLHRLATAADSELTLTGLSVDEIIELAVALGHPRPARREAMRLKNHTGGNPLYVQALLDDLASGASTYNPHALPAPRAFTANVDRTLHDADPCTRRLIRSAAVLGMRCSLRLASRVADLPDALEVLEDATSLGVVDAVRDPTDWVVAFRHPLIRAAVYDATGPASLMRMHSRAATLLEEPEALDHLVAAASVPDADLAERLRVQASADELAGRPSRAAERLMAAARFVPDAQEREALVLEAFEQLLAAGEVWDASQLQSQILAMPATVRRDLVLARLAWLQGHHDESVLLAEAAWSDASATPAQRADAALMIAQLKVLSDHGEEAAHWADLAAAFPDLPSEVSSWARLHRAVGLCISGRPEDGVASLSDLPTTPADVPIERLSEFWARGCLRLWCDDVAGAFADLREQSTDLKGWWLQPYGLIRQGYLAQAEYRMGAWSDSLSHAHATAALIADGDQVWLLAFGHTLPVWVLAARGDWDRASDHVRRAMRAAADMGDRASINFAANASVHLEACRGDTDGVISAAEPVRTAKGGAQVAGILTWHCEYASALIAHRRLDEAREVLDRLSSQAERRQLGSVRAAIARVRGELAATLRDPVSARQAFIKAEQLCTARSEPFDQARTWLAHGIYLRRAGERRAAADRLRSARDTFEHLGANPFLERCLDELAACGFPNDRSPDPAHPRLTPQELAVARLVSAGKTNKEVAAQLVVSVKTVGYHLANIYLKYGVRSRTELASVFPRAGKP